MEQQFSPHGSSVLPMIHVYSFQSTLNPNEGLLKDVRLALGYDIEESALSVHNVRDVSPHKVIHYLHQANSSTCSVVALGFLQK